MSSAIFLILAIAVIAWLVYEIRRALGIAIADAEPPQRNASYTKAGPGRRANSKPAVKTLKQKRAGAYGRGLRNWIKQKQAVAQSTRLSRRMAASIAA